MNTSRRSTQLFLIMAFMLALCLVFLAACEKPEAASDATSDDEAAASTAEDEGSSAADSAADSADTAGRTFYVDNEGEIHNAPVCTTPITNSQVIGFGPIPLTFIPCDDGGLSPSGIVSAAEGQSCPGTEDSENSVFQVDVSGPNQSVFQYNGCAQTNGGNGWNPSYADVGTDPGTGDEAKPFIPDPVLVNQPGG